MTTKLTDNAGPLRVLLIGNNPIDMSSTLQKVQQIRGKRVVTEIAFDLRSIAERVSSFDPNFILIDDDLGKVELEQAISWLSENRKTKKIPITVIKNSNYEESSPSLRVLDFILKQNFSAEGLYRTILNSLKFERTQRLLSKVYRRRKGQHRLAF